MVDGAVPPETIRAYQTDPELQDKINVYPSDALRYISFNLPVPPFDDIHVRKAFNWALDKEGCGSSEVVRRPVRSPGTSW